MKRKVFTFSDTHIGASYSNPSPEQEAVIRAGIKAADIVVIAGDAFEFTQSPHTNEHQLSEARRIITQWQKYNPNAEFHFVPGNHEAPRNYKMGQPRLKEVRELWPQLRETMESLGVHTHEEYCRVGDAVIVHGHMETCKKQEKLPNETEMMGWHHMGNLGAPGTLLAKRHFPLSRVIPAIHRLLKTALNRDEMPLDPEASAEDLANAKPPVPAAPIGKIIFGHIHYNFFNKKLKPMPGLSLGDDIRYFNTGCSVNARPSQFQPLMFSLEGDLATGKTSEFSLAKTYLSVSREQDATQYQALVSEIGKGMPFYWKQLQQERALKRANAEIEIS